MRHVFRAQKWPAGQRPVKRTAMGPRRKRLHPEPVAQGPQRWPAVPHCGLLTFATSTIRQTEPCTGTVSRLEPLAIRAPYWPAAMQHVSGPNIGRETADSALPWHRYAVLNHLHSGPSIGRLRRIKMCNNEGWQRGPQPGGQACSAGSWHRQSPALACSRGLRLWPCQQEHASR